MDVKLSEVAVLLPAYNEEKALPDMLAKLSEQFDKSQIILVNDGSTDATSKVAREAGVKVIDLAINMGIGVAVQSGYQFALQEGFNYVVRLDADGQHRAEQVTVLLEKMAQTGADMVIGSRFVDKEGEGFQSFFFRRIAIRFLSGWIRLLIGLTVYDVTSGFRLVNKNALKVYAHDYPFDYPEPESIIQLTHHGYKTVEVPVSMRERQGGVSSIGFFEGLYYIIKVTLGLVLTKLR